MHRIFDIEVLFTNRGQTRVKSYTWLLPLTSGAYNSASYHMLISAKSKWSTGIISVTESYEQLGMFKG